MLWYIIFILTITQNINCKHVKIAKVSPDYVSYNKNVSYRIVGGKIADMYRWPFVVAFYLDNQQCGGGSLISSKCVLTVAHLCTKSNGDSWTAIDKGRIRLQLGSIYLDRGFIVKKPSNILIHPNYNPDTAFNDLAIIILEDKVRMKQGLSFARLSHYTPPEGK